MHPGSDLVGVKVAQPITSGCSHHILGAYSGDSSNFHTQDPAQAGAGGGRPRAAPKQPGAAPGVGGQDRRKRLAGGDGQPGAAPRQPGATPGGGGRDRREPEALEAMYPRSFLNTRGVLSECETPEAINMSLDSPESPEEAGAAAMSPSPDTTYEAEEEADMLLNQAETGAVEEPVEVKAESPVYVAQVLSPD